MPRIAKPKRKLRIHYLKEWREKNGLTQEQAANRIGMDRTTLGRIEKRQVPYSQGMLEAAAEAYNCEPWDLLNVNPEKEGDVIDRIDAFRQYSDSEQAEALDWIKFKRSQAS